MRGFIAIYPFGVASIVVIQLIKHDLVPASGFQPSMVGYGARNHQLNLQALCDARLTHPTPIVVGFVR